MSTATASRRRRQTLSADRVGQSVAIQGMDCFVGRTTNWLYDHLRCLPDYRPFVVCTKFANRDEFPEIDAMRIDRWHMSRRIWQRLSGKTSLPTDILRLKRLRPKVFHTHFGDAAIWYAELVQQLGLPWVVSFYGADAYQFGDRDYRQVFSRAQRVTALGPVMKQRLIDLGCPTEKITVHPLGVDVTSIPYHPREYQRGETLNILFAGTFREKKGIEYLLAAVAKLHQQDAPVRLHLVGDACSKPGDAETKQTILQSIQDLGIEPIVTRYGFLPFRSMMKLSLDCHVFVAPSVQAHDGDCEGTPFVIQQMMASGIPVVSTWHSDIPSIMGDELTDQLVPERDATALASTLQRFVEQPYLVLERGNAARNRIVSAFDIRSCGQLLADTYSKIEKA